MWGAFLKWNYTGNFYLVKSDFEEIILLTKGCNSVLSVFVWAALSIERLNLHEVAATKSLSLSSVKCCTLKSFYIREALKRTITPWPTSPWVPSTGLAISVTRCFLKNEIIVISVRCKLICFHLVPSKQWNCQNCLVSQMCCQDLLLSWSCDIVKKGALDCEDRWWHCERYVAASANPGGDAREWQEVDLWRQTCLFQILF